MLEVNNLCAAYGSKEILHNVSFMAAQGDCIAVLGPNGVGKSTLFRCLLGFLKQKSGSISIAGHDISALSRAETAKLIAYIPQNAAPIYNYTVLDTVLMGVTSSLPAFRGPSPAHTERAMELLSLLGISRLAGNGVSNISGGERQLAQIGRALIQDARVLIMDEPTSHLDYGNSFNVMEQVTELGKRGYTVIFSTHEPNHALSYAGRVIAMKDGSVFASGDPKTTLTSGVLSELYGVGVLVSTILEGENSYVVSIPHK